MATAVSSISHFAQPMEWLGLLRATAKAWSEDKALRLSAALAYYSIFSIAPLLVITIAIAGFALGKEAAAGQLYETMSGYVGSKAATGLESMVESASKPKAGVIATIVGSITLLLGASGVLGQLKDALNTIWKVRIKKGAGWKYMLRSRFLNFGMVLVIGLLLLVSLVLTSWLAALDQSLHSMLSLPAWIWTILTVFLSMGVSTALFAMLFKILPDARIQWRDVWVGAAITAVLFEIGKTALGWYLGREGADDAYGAAGAVVLLILWVYYSSGILLFGAEFTQTYAVARGHAIEPAPHAEIDTYGATGASRAGIATGGSMSTPALARPTMADVIEAADSARPLRSDPAFSHRLLAPLLKYLEGRGLLFSIEAREALGEAITLLVIGAVCIVSLIVAWILLAVFLVGMLVAAFQWNWLAAVGMTLGVHLLAVVGAGLLLWWRAKRGAWFKETFNEFRKDRLWLRGATGTGSRHA
jgi:membrane protein